MRTTHLTTLKTAFSPFSTTGKTPRLFLTLLPPNAHHRIKITQMLLPRNSAAPAMLEIGFKDGKTFKYQWELHAEQTQDAVGNGKKEKRVILADIVEEVERHERLLARKQELAG